MAEKVSVKGVMLEDPDQYNCFDFQLESGKIVQVRLVGKARQYTQGLRKGVEVEVTGVPTIAAWYCKPTGRPAPQEPNNEVPF